MANGFTIDQLNTANPLGNIQAGDLIVAERGAGNTGVVAYSTTANGVVSTGLINQLAYYQAAGNTVSGLTIVNSAALLTNGSGVPGLVAYTGSGSPVLATSPTLVTPLLGTPTSGVLTNCTGLPIASGISGLGTGVATFLATPTSLNLKTAVTDETGSGSLVFATSPTLVTPILGTPTSGTLTSCTGLPISTGVSGLGTGIATALASNLNGTGAITATTSPILVTPALGVPSSGTLTSCTGLPISTGVSGLGTGVATGLANAVTGSGSPVLATSPTLVTPLLGTPTSGTLTNCTGLPIAGIASLGTGVATVLAAAVSGSTAIACTNSPIFVTPALGTPSSGTLTSCTGLPISTGISGLGTNVATALGATLNGSGALSATTSCTFVTPTLGAALATSLQLSNTGLIDTNAKVALALSATASAVNGFTLTNSATTVSPSLAATGTDTNISFIANGKGTGGCLLGASTSGSLPASTYVGYKTSASASAVAIATNTATNVTSISVPAGNWLVVGQVTTAPASTTTQAYLAVSITSSSGTLSSPNTLLAAYSGANTPAGMEGITTVLSLSSPTTYYLVAQVSYTVSTLTISGTLTLIRLP